MVDIPINRLALIQGIDRFRVGGIRQDSNRQIFLCMIDHLSIDALYGDAFSGPVTGNKMESGHIAWRTLYDLDVFVIGDDLLNITGIEIGRASWMERV